MPIGATLGAAVIGAGATLASSHSNSNAINKATQTQQDSTAQQIAFQQQARAENTAALSPFMTRGNTAGDTINGALGLGGAGGSDPAAAAAQAYSIFKTSIGYNTRFDEGMRALNAGYAGAGLLQSGAAEKAAIKYGQNFASNEFGNWLGYLGNQQGVGLSGASALAGVSQNSANNMSNISQNAANAAGSAAALTANNNNALVSSLSNIAGNAAGSLSSYSRPPVNYNTPALTPSASYPMTGAYLRQF